MLGAYPLQKKEETPRFLLFSLIVRRYDLREVDGVSCRIFDIYPVAAERAARGVDPAAEAAVSADLPVFKRAVVQECSFARGKADARAVAHKADVRDV